MAYRTKLRRISATGRRVADLYEFFMAKHIRHAGNDSYYGEPFMLEKWQRDYMWRPVFGTGKMVRGTFRRHYRRAVFCVPRDYGKSEISCGMILTIANMEPVYNGQYGLVASSEEQAKKLLKKLKTMVALDDDLRALWTPLKRGLANVETGAEILVFPYSESAVQGWHFNAVVCDEIHVWPNSDVWEAIISGMRDIPNSLTIATTTVSGKAKGFCYELLTDIAPSDPACYCWWFGADDHIKADDRRMWRRLAIPSWISFDGIEDAFRSESRSKFERYILNRFPESETGYRAIRQSAILACARQSADFDFSSYFAVGVDGATSGDTLAICCYQEQDGRDVFFEFAWEEPDADGFYDFLEVADVISVLANKPGRPLIAYDPARMVLLMKYIERYAGAKAFALGQTPKVMCPACEMLRHSIESKAACLAGVPVLADHAGNACEAVSKAYGMRFTSPGAGKSKRKIDMAIAASMAMYVYRNADRPKSFSGSQFSFAL